MKIQPFITDDALADAAMKLAKDRAERELDVLLNMSGGLRQSLPILAELGVGLEQFGEDDTRAIFTALEFSAWRTFDVCERERYCRTALRHANLWVDDDLRGFVGGMRWGPGPLAVLFTRLDYDPVELIIAAYRLIDAIQAQTDLSSELRGAA